MLKKWVGLRFLLAVVALSLPLVVLGCSSGGTKAESSTTAKGTVATTSNQQVTTTGSVASAVIPTTDTTEPDTFTTTEPVESPPTSDSSANPTSSTSSLKQAAGTWTDLNPTNPPPGQIMHVLVYCSSIRKMIMFSGADFRGPFDDTWSYDPAANTWTKLAPSGGSPPPRQQYAMVYDPDTDKVILFGGGRGQPLFNETWSYDPAKNTWTHLHPEGDVPPNCQGPAMVYDPVSKNIIRFGGMTFTGDENETWAYDPAKNTWRNLHPSVSPPGQRILPSMVYDPVGRKMVMWGGLMGAAEAGADFAADTWAYDPAANTWTKVASAGPPWRWGQCMAYDPGRKQVVMFGGSSTGSYPAEVWTYDPADAKWTQFNTTGIAPQGRWFSSWAYDPVSERLIMFGGERFDVGADQSDVPTDFGDTWSFKP
jgi:N-acetylneuraminic acid mutarotase